MSTININELSEEELDLLLERAPHVEQVVAFGQDFYLLPVDGVEPTTDIGTWWVVHLVTILSPSQGRAFKLPILYPAYAAIETFGLDPDNVGDGILAALDALDALDQLNSETTYTLEGTDQ